MNSEDEKQVGQNRLNGEMKAALTLAARETRCVRDPSRFLLRLVEAEGSSAKLPSDLSRASGAALKMLLAVLMMTVSKTKKDLLGTRARQRLGRWLSDSWGYDEQFFDETYRSEIEGKGFGLIDVVRELDRWAKEYAKGLGCDAPLMRQKALGVLSTFLESDEFGKNDYFHRRCEMLRCLCDYKRTRRGEFDPKIVYRICNGDCRLTVATLSHTEGSVGFLKPNSHCWHLSQWSIKQIEGTEQDGWRIVPKVIGLSLVAEEVEENRSRLALARGGSPQEEWVLFKKNSGNAFVVFNTTCDAPLGCVGENPVATNLRFAGKKSTGVDPGMWQIEPVYDALTRAALPGIGL